MSRYLAWSKNRHFSAKSGRNTVDKRNNSFAGTNLIAAGAGIAVLVATMLVINIRYTLMSFALAQKMGNGFNFSRKVCFDHKKKSVWIIKNICRAA